MRLLQWTFINIEITWATNTVDLEILIFETLNSIAGI